jgi:rsbT antagonist protein RsbS
MASPRPRGVDPPLQVSILSQSANLIVSIHTALDDGQLMRLQRELIDTIGRQRSRGVVIDVAAIDVLDSFAVRTLTDLSHMARLRGAETVVVGIAAEVAMAMVRLSLRTGDLRTALDLEEGIELLSRINNHPSGAAGDRPRSRP